MSSTSHEINSFGWYHDTTEIRQTQPNIYTLFWRFDLIKRSSSEEAGTQFFDREQERPTRWIKEAVHIRKEGHRAMNRDEGSYQLSHAYDRFLDATADRRIKTRKNWVPASSDDLVMRSKRRNNV